MGAEAAAPDTGVLGARGAHRAPQAATGGVAHARQCPWPTDAECDCTGVFPRSRLLVSWCMPCVCMQLARLTAPPWAWQHVTRGCVIGLGVPVQIWATPASTEETATMNTKGAQEDDASSEHSSPSLTNASHSPASGISLSPLAAFNLGLQHHALAPLILGQGVLSYEQQQQQGSRNPGSGSARPVPSLKVGAMGNSGTLPSSLKSWYGRVKLVPLSPSFLKQGFSEPEPLHAERMPIQLMVSSAGFSCPGAKP
eukprot:1151693-Pelagomonas_calceolata.AAC.2